jgi:hypothetical protein
MAGLTLLFYHRGYNFNMRIWKVAALLLVGTLALLADDPTVKLRIVVKTVGGHPIDRAEVVVRWHADPKHPQARYGRAVNTTWELRTNQEGEANVPEIPQGEILIQINAKGYQTYGKTYDVEEAEKTIEIPLNPPQQQYSAH